MDNHKDFVSPCEKCVRFKSCDGKRYRDCAAYQAWLKKAWAQIKEIFNDIKAKRRRSL